MIVEAPKTIEEYLEVRQSILDLMGNPYCDQLMFLSLSERLNNVDIKIKKLNKSNGSTNNK